MRKERAKATNDIKEVSNADAIKLMFSKHRESAEKLDYFLCGISAALFAYIGEKFTPSKDFHASEILIMSALLFLSLGFYAGCRRILICNSAVRENQKQFESEELAARMIAKLKNCGEVYVTDNDEQVPRAEAIIAKDNLLDEVEHFKQTRAFCETMQMRYASERDFLVFGGFVLIVLSKFLQWFE